MDILETIDGMTDDEIREFVREECAEDDLRDVVEFAQELRFEALSELSRRVSE